MKTPSPHQGTMAVTSTYKRTHLPNTSQTKRMYISSHMTTTGGPPLRHALNSTGRPTSLLSMAARIVIIVDKFVTHTFFNRDKMNMLETL